MRNNNNDDIFKDTGLKISLLQYQTGRYLMISLLFLMLIYSFFKNGNISLKHLLITIFIYLISAPVREFLGKKTPFYYFIYVLKNEYRNKLDLEIFRSISQLKNLAIAQKDKPFGADFIIQQLMKFSNITKPVYIKMLSKYRMGQEEEACKYFAEAIGTNYAKELANIFLKLDKINPGELVEQLTLYQVSIREEWRTKKMRKFEAISDIIFIPIIASALIVLLNFVVIVVYIEQASSIFNL